MKMTFSHTDDFSKGSIQIDISLSIVGRENLNALMGRKELIKG